ncbi:CDP-diacylglycerol--serine O-phosphatidyltransferase, partial [Coxiella burnetii]
VISGPIGTLWSLHKRRRQKKKLRRQKN